MFDKKIYERLSHYCAENERSATDVVRKLRLLKIDPSEFDAYLAALKTDNFLHEQRFAKLYIEAHSRKKWGKMKMKSALLQKGISNNLIDEQLKQVEEKGYTEGLHYLAEKKIKSIRKGTAQEKKGKLLRFLLGRGFEMSKVLEAIKTLS